MREARERGKAAPDSRRAKSAPAASEAGDGEADEEDAGESSPGSRPPAVSGRSSPEDQAPAGGAAGLLGIDPAMAQQLVDAVSRLTPAPSSTPAPAQHTRPQQAAAGAQTQTQSADPQGLNDAEIDALVDQLGLDENGQKVIRSLAGTVKAQQDQLRQFREQTETAAARAREEAEARAVSAVMPGFVERVGKIGLSDVYGDFKAAPATQQQAQARVTLVQRADAAWTLLGRTPETLEQALNITLYALHREQIERGLTKAGEDSVRARLEKRQGMLDATPGRTAGTPAAEPEGPDGAKQVVRQYLKSRDRSGVA